MWGITTTVSLDVKVIVALLETFGLHATNLLSHVDEHAPWLCSPYRRYFFWCFGEACKTDLLLAHVPLMLVFFHHHHYHTTSTLVSKRH